MRTLSLLCQLRRKSKRFDGRGDAVIVIRVWVDVPAARFSWFGHLRFPITTV